MEQFRYLPEGAERRSAPTVSPCNGTTLIHDPPDTRTVLAKQITRVLEQTFFQFPVATSNGGTYSPFPQCHQLF